MENWWRSGEDLMNKWWRTDEALTNNLGVLQQLATCVPSPWQNWTGQNDPFKSDSWFIPSLWFDKLQCNAITASVETEIFIQKILFGTELMIYQKNP